MEQTNQKPLQEEKKKRSAGRIAGLAAEIGRASCRERV